jgi:hypothetical protein
LRTEFEHVLHRLTVIRVLLHLQHVHERAVIHAVHAQRPHEIPFHEPEGFRQQQRVRRFRLDAVDHFPPEFLRERAVELFLRHAVLGP